MIYAVADIMDRVRKVFGAAANSAILCNPNRSRVIYFFFFEDPRERETDTSDATKEGQQGRAKVREGRQQRRAARRGTGTTQKPSGARHHQKRYQPDTPDGALKYPN